MRNTCANMLAWLKGLRGTRFREPPRSCRSFSRARLVARPPQVHRPRGGLARRPGLPAAGRLRAADPGPVGPRRVGTHVDTGSLRGAGPLRAGGGPRNARARQPPRRPGPRAPRHTRDLQGDPGARQRARGQHKGGARGTLIPSAVAGRRAAAPHTNAGITHPGVWHGPGDAGPA